MNPKIFLCFGLIWCGTIGCPPCHAEIIYPQAPKGAEEAITNALNSRFWKLTTHLPPAKQLIIAKPFGLYWYKKNYTNLFSGQLLSATELASWRFLLTDGTNSTALDLSYDEKKKKWPEMDWVGHMVFPNVSDPVLQALQAAEKLPQVREEDYELRYLNFLQIQFDAVWLHGKTNDIIIPVPVFGKWQDYRPYSEHEVIELLKHEIEDRMNLPSYKKSRKGQS